MTGAPERQENRTFAEERDSLWRIALAPLIWVGHFIAAYAGTSLVCAKLGGDGGAFLFLRVSIAVLTVLALAGILLVAWRSWKQWNFFDDWDYEHEQAIEEDRHEFLGHASFLLAIISAVGVIYVALPAIFLGVLHVIKGACIVAGAAVALAVWLWPPVAPLSPFAEHMVRHMGLVVIAAPLLAIGVVGRGLPPIPPLGATLAEFVAVWGWHLPAAHALAKGSLAGLVAEQASFLAVGLALWLSVLQPGRALAGAGGLLLTSMHMTLLGALLILANRDLYPSAVCAGLADQQLGGMIMLGLGTPIYLFAGLALTARVLTGPRERAA